jgi:NitT/TauT family transport system substrate-binding protein
MEGLPMPQTQTRRSFLSMTALAGAAGILPPRRRAWAAEPALETTTVRLGKLPVICFAPQYVCEALLRAEGFADIRYVDTTPQTQLEDLGRGKFDFQSNLPHGHVLAIDSGLPITVVTGVHAGCYELFAHGDIRGLADLKGKRVGALDSSLLRLMAAYVGIDPKNDLNLIDDPAAKPLELFAEGKLDGYLANPPEVQELHARKTGHVILRSAVDKPWSQYFCCMLAANREYMARHPMATKRVIRAVLKAADLCASKPELAAKLIVEGGFTESYDYALQTLTENPYDAWREYDAEDSLRFYALRLHDLGTIKSTPQQIIANGTDWRFLNELKRELKT